MDHAWRVPPETPDGDPAAELARLVDLATPFAVRAAASLRLPGQVHGTPFWADYQRDERLRLFFGAIMAAHAWQTGPAVAAAYDWAPVRTVIDVGGGIGALLAEVLRAHPHLRGAVLDLPEVAPE